MGRKAQYKVIEDQTHKLCKGVLHREGKWVPVHNFYMDRIWLRSWCKDCEREHTRPGGEPYVLRADYMFAITELINRLGKYEAARRCDIKWGSFWRIVNGKHKYMQRSVARRIIRALAEVRTEDEIRHRDSIRHGAAKRGRKEKMVTNRHTDIYKRHGDSDTESKRRRQRGR
jgi:hypothetical protein